MEIRRRLLCQKNGVKNYLDGVVWTEGYSISLDGTVSPNNDFMISGLIKLLSGNYVFSAKNLNAYRRTVRIHGYTDGGVWESQIAYQAAATNQMYNVTFSVPPNVAKIQISLIKQSSDLMLVNA